MHEHSFIQSILKDIQDKDNVISIDIELGELVGIEENHLRDHLFDETGWKINISLKKAKIKCPCGYEGPPTITERLHDMVIYECPACGLIGPEIFEGNKIKILKVIYK
ncbi:MAG: hydrogenase/urease maturation nickel metallochaperone HypA [Candidatus Pacearchaeota archaeon]|jgi:Zn finger protein HypA/HybF involved in hydrogenase expression